MSDTNTTYSRFLHWRGVEEPCDTCSGSGVRAYANTATWHGGMGGASITHDVCDQCWGTGDKHRKGVDLRAMERDFNARVTREALTLIERRLGLRFADMRKGIEEIAGEIEKIAGKRRSVIDPTRLAGNAVVRLLREFAQSATESPDGDKV